MRYCLDEQCFVRIADTICVASISRALGACGFSMFLVGAPARFARVLNARRSHFQDRLLCVLSDLGGVFLAIGVLRTLVIWKRPFRECCCGSAVDGAIGGGLVSACGAGIIILCFGSPQQLPLICFEAAIGAAMWACGMLLAIRDRGKKFIRLWSIF